MSGTYCYTMKEENIKHTMYNHLILKQTSINKKNYAASVKEEKGV